MPVQAVRAIRKMRGGAQAHLVEASDGSFYVVKFRNNPQHRRILVNEWIGTAFLRYLGIAAPACDIVEVRQEFLAENPEVRIQLGSRTAAVEPGWHFGSKFPGDPARTVVYDFLPDALLDRVENRADFLGTLAFDKWTGNADSRQAIFFRARVNDGDTSRQGFVAQMMDHGYLFEGPHWRLTDSPLYGLYFRPLVYRDVRGIADFEPWLERIVNFPDEVVDEAVRRIPSAWLDGEEAELDALLDRLMARRKRVPEFIEASRGGRIDPFPKWKAGRG